MCNYFLHNGSSDLYEEISTTPADFYGREMDILDGTSERLVSLGGLVVADLGAMLYILSEGDTIGAFRCPRLLHGQMVSRVGRSLQRTFW